MGTHTMPPIFDSEISHHTTAFASSILPDLNTSSSLANGVRWVYGWSHQAVRQSGLKPLWSKRLPQNFI